MAPTAAGSRILPEVAGSDGTSTSSPRRCVRESSASATPRLVGYAAIAHTELGEALLPLTVTKYGIEVVLEEPPPPEGVGSDRASFGSGRAFNDASSSSSARAWRRRRRRHERDGDRITWRSPSSVWQGSRHVPNGCDRPAAWSNRTWKGDTGPGRWGDVNAVSRESSSVRIQRARPSVGIGTSHTASAPAPRRPVGEAVSAAPELDGATVRSTDRPDQDAARTICAAEPLRRPECGGCHPVSSGRDETAFRPYPEIRRSTRAVRLGLIDNKVVRLQWRSTASTSYNFDSRTTDLHRQPNALRRVLDGKTWSLRTRGFRHRGTGRPFPTLGRCPATPPVRVRGRALQVVLLSWRMLGELIWDAEPRSSFGRDTPKPCWCRSGTTRLPSS